MSEAKLESLDGGRFRIIGPMNFETAVSLLDQSERQFHRPTISVDLTGVSETDSAGLALIIEWVKSARAHQRTLTFENLPAQLVALARISEVDDLLGITHDELDVDQPLRKESVG